MARSKLTAAAIDRFRPPKAGQVEYFDELLRSFGLRVSYSGTKAWFVMTRVNGKLIRVTIGRYPAIGLADARKRAQEIMRLAAEGIDPRHVEEEKRLKRQVDIENTFGRLAEHFMAKHVEPNLRDTTAREYQRILFGKDTAKWRARPVNSIKKRDVLDLMDAIDARGSKSAAALSLAYLRKFFNWCVEREIIESSPMDRFRLGRNLRSRERVLSEDELRLIWTAFDAETGLFGSLFQLLLLTGQRRNEVAGMRWDELRDIDTDQAIWEIPSGRTKNRRTHLVPLTPHVVNIITAMPRTGACVFSSTGDKPVSGFSKPKARIDQRIVDLAEISNSPAMPPWRLHDMRRIMVTMMNEHLGVAPHIVEAVVNHVTGSAKAGVAGVYNRALYMDERRQALDLWSDRVSQISVGGQKEDYRD
jgi:integrase